MTVVAPSAQFPYISRVNRKNLLQNPLEVTSMKAVDFFCGAGGMSIGMKQSGIEILGGIDIDETCRETYESNLGKDRFHCADIRKMSAVDLRKMFGIDAKDENLILIGCSPCQFWSKIQTNKNKAQAGMNLLFHFGKIVKELLPGYVVIENVPGILRNTKSPLSTFIALLRQNGYSTMGQGVVNASEYGVPQNRKRFVLIASRNKGKSDIFPKVVDTPKNSVRDWISDPEEFPAIQAGETWPSDLLHSAAKLSNENLQRISMTPANGGTRQSWQDTKLQIAAYIGKDNSFRDVYGRMFWDRPAPTITTRFNSISNGRFGHPEQNRAISLREGARLQTFPSDFQFIGNSQNVIARQIGNAVPPLLAQRIAETIIDFHTKWQTSKQRQEQ